MGQVGGRRKGHVGKVKAAMTGVTLINVFTRKMERWHGDRRAKRGDNVTRCSQVVRKPVTGVRDYERPDNRVLESLEGDP